MGRWRGGGGEEEGRWRGEVEGGGGGGRWRGEVEGGGGGERWRGEHKPELLIRNSLGSRFRSGQIILEWVFSEYNQISHVIPSSLEGQSY